MKLNFQELKQVCLSPVESFEALGETFTTPDGNLIYIDNGSNILAIAHLDSVPETSHFHVIRMDGSLVVLNGQLDDRLGVYSIVNYLPALGLKYDILLTDMEESHRSTGAHFLPRKDYLWMFQFDRRGNDVVHYQYKDESMKRALNGAGFKEYSHGSGSDISKMAHVGCIGINLGVGYYDEHSAWCKMDVDEWYSQMRKFVKLYNEISNTQFPYPGSTATTAPKTAKMAKKVSICSICKTLKNVKKNGICNKCSKEMSTSWTTIIKDEPLFVACLLCLAYDAEKVCAVCTRRQEKSTWLTMLECDKCRRRIWSDDYFKGENRICVNCRLGKLPRYPRYLGNYTGEE